MVSRSFLAQFVKVPDGWRVLVDRPYDVRGSFALPQALADFRRTSKTIEADLRSRRDPEAFMAEWSRELSRAFFADKVGLAFSRSMGFLDHAAESHDRRACAALSVRLRFQPGHTELLALPWELLQEPLKGEHLSRCRQTPIVRELGVPVFVRALEYRPPLRVLMVHSLPLDQPSLDTDSEAYEVETALREEVSTGVEIESLYDVGLNALREKLNQFGPHVIHFMGHGSLEKHSAQGILSLVGREGDEEQVKARVLGECLANFVRPGAASQQVGRKGALRVVIFSCCRSGQHAHDSSGSPATSLATAAVEAGVPAVVAMQNIISDRAAVDFSRMFYARLAALDPVEVAVSEARVAISQDWKQSWEWLTPALYMRAEDGNLFAMRDTARLEEPLQISIRSLRPYGLDSANHLDLLPYFEQRFILKQSYWDSRILPKVVHFLDRMRITGRPLALHLNAHTTIAFLAGYMLEANCGVKIDLEQRSRDGRKTWSASDHTEKSEGSPSAMDHKSGAQRPAGSGPRLTWQEVALDQSEGAEVAVAVSLANPALNMVSGYLSRSQGQVGRLFHAALPSPGKSAVTDGAHAIALADQLVALIQEQLLGQPLHFFISAPNGFTFFLAQQAQAFGELTLYEYDFERLRHGTYEPSLTLNASRIYDLLESD